MNSLPTSSYTVVSPLIAGNPVEGLVTGGDLAGGLLRVDIPVQYTYSLLTAGDSGRTLLIADNPVDILLTAGDAVNSLFAAVDPVDSPLMAVDLVHRLLTVSDPVTVPSYIERS